MDVDRSPTDIHPLEYLIALGNDPRYNYNRLENPWYGLWVAVLRVFETITYCQLFPQYSIWMVTSQEDTESEYHPSPGFNLDSKRNIPGPSLPVIPFTPVSTKQHRSIYSDSPWTVIPSTPPRPRKAQSFLARPDAPGEVYGKLRKDVPQNKNVRPPSPPNLSGSERDSDEPYNPLNSRKIPDFAISYTSGRRRSPVQASKRPNIVIERRIIALLVEVKLYHCVGDDHDLEDSQLDALQKLADAMKGLVLQIEYLFSPRFLEGKQPAVIGIAASGFFWSWAQFTNKDGEAVLNMANPTTGDILPGWSNKYEIGTEKSNIMLDRIRHWVKNLVANPDATQFAIIQEP